MNPYESIKNKHILESEHNVITFHSLCETLGKLDVIMESQARIIAKLEGTQSEKELEQMLDKALSKTKQYVTTAFEIAEEIRKSKTK